MEEPCPLRWGGRHVGHGQFRALFAALIALLSYAVTDLLVWQRIFESNELIEYADTCRLGWFFLLTGYATVGVIMMSARWKDCVFFITAFGIGAYSGLEDVLCYVLDRKPLPASLPWMSGTPLIFGHSRTRVISSVQFCPAALTLLYVMMFIWQRRPRGGQASSGGRTSLDTHLRR